jgi:hypothetical protein
MPSHFQPTTLRAAALIKRFSSCLVVAILFASCGKGPESNAPKTSESVVPKAVPSSGTAHATPAPAKDSEDCPVAPGLDQKKFIAPLKDAYERLDPLKDGWETEAFNNSAMVQIHALEHLLTAPEPVAPENLSSVAEKTIQSTPLRPDKPVKAFDDGRIQVFRAGPNAPAPVSGIEAFAADLNALKKAAPGIDPHLKIVKVTRQSASAVNTSVLADIIFNSAGERRQITGTWSCDWFAVNAGHPTLSALRVTQYEEAVQPGSGDPLFTDTTAAVLDRNASYKEQLLVPTDYWRARLPRDLGLDPVANHGLAIGDVNGDGLDDLYICQQGGLPNRLFIQNADGTLRDATAESGTGWLDFCAAALFLDLDNDGDEDLVISQDFRVLVMSNDGKGKFTLEFGAGTKAQSFSLAAADYDNDGLVDFYICGYNPSQAEMRSGAMGEPLPFNDANNGGRNILWRNDGKFHFTDVTASVGLDVNNTRYSFAAAWEDYDNDGDQDLCVANDYGRKNLYRNDGGKFRDVAPELGVEDRASGMSVSWADFNRDGYMDLYMSNMFSSAGNRITFQNQFKTGLNENLRSSYRQIARGNSLFQAVPGGAFKDVSVEAGVTIGRWAWGSKFVDFNNDGFDDILVANGFITTADSGDL